MISFVYNLGSIDELCGKGKRSIKVHKERINYISLFPSNNIISVSNDKSINIYDLNFKILQTIKNG